MIKLNGKPINITMFPDKTSQVWKVEGIQPHNEIEWYFSNEGEVFQLLQLVRLLRKNNNTSSLYIDYLPYARQDKPISNDATFALTPFCELLNIYKFTNIVILDPHSMHPLWMLDNCKDIYPTKKVENLYSLTKSDVLCYPDKGAVTKYKTLYKHNYIFGEKVRDSSTGIITDYKIQGTIKGQKILIVDDICDGGMTFILLADKLLSEGALEINLFVTHGIFSKGLACLKAAGIGRIFTNKGEAFERSNSIVYKEIEQCVK